MGPPQWWSGFYKLTLEERSKLLSDFNGLNPLKVLTNEKANLMVENCIGIIGIPLGLALNFVIDGKEILPGIPMATEEPSVIAAASSAAKMIKSFTTETSPLAIVDGQIFLQVSSLVHDALIQFNALKSEIISKINQDLITPAMKNRESIVVDVSFKSLPCDCGLDNAVAMNVELNADQAMGANMINSLLEKLAPFMEDKFPFCKALFKILSNISQKKTAKASFKLSIKELSYKGIPAEEMAQRIILNYKWALLDPFRLVTYNKGVMNGVVAVGLAFRQDTRALEAAAHACNQPLTKYYMNDCGEFLCGEISLPVPIGIVGGACRETDLFSTLAITNWKQLASIMACVGLANNFAAIRAISSTGGIQSGHMPLHNRKSQQ